MSLCGLRDSIRKSAVALVAMGVVCVALGAPVARAADAPIFASGEPVVTGFSGVVPPAAPPAGSDPLDRTFIDPDGHSAVVQQLQPDGAPAGQLIASPPVFAATAKDVGQVFGVALDNAPELTGAAAPNIYLSATSAYGLNLVVPGPDGQPVRSKTGAPDASFMAGQWGGAGGETGYPGSIWKIDGTTGEISLFSTIAANTGAGLGDIVYDPATSQFFVSDLDSGLIYRLGLDGAILDSFDHGVTGRPAHALAAVADDGSAVDVTDPAFNTEDPASWGFTQPERKVYGLAVHGGRLYYAVAAGPQIWSVGIKADGSFGAPRWELDVTGLPSGNEITGIAFDPQGRMILAQRGPQVGSYDYSVFAEPKSSSVVRYAREFPDDPATPSVWTETPDSYAIGYLPEGNNASGGVALGPKYDDASGMFDGACNATLWATGDSLRDDASLDPPLQVAGLQGNARGLVRPDNDPPGKSFFADYDGKTDDAEAANQGHVGSVAIWQDCSGEAYVPPDVLPPPHYVPPPHFNLTLSKWSSPHFCLDGGASWWCNFTIRVENTGTVPYWGPIRVDDHLPAGNPGASMHFWPQPPWACAPTGPVAYQCVRGPDLLYPGDSVDLHEVVQLPKALVGYCQLPNVAGLDWSFWGHDDDPSDDYDFGVAGINAPGCVPPGGGADLVLHKFALPDTCVDNGLDWACRFGVMVQNVGPGNFSGPIQVKDTLGVNAPATTVGPWACGQVGPVLTCNIAAPPVNAPPGWSSGFLVTAHVKKNIGQPLCSLDNKANIATPPGGSPMNLVAGNDFDSATATIPDPACLLPQPHTDLQLAKTPTGCAPFVYMGTNGYLCGWSVTITNLGPNVFHGPLWMSDTTAAATYNSLTGFLGCTGAPTVITCKSLGAVTLNPGVPVAIPMQTFYPGGASVCSVTNTASILNPAPGSAPNPAGNDSQSAAQPVPNPGCAGLGPKLNITKTATGCASDPSSTDWLCGFHVVVTNYGSGPQPAPLVVNDHIDKPTTFVGGNCVPAGPLDYTCTRVVPLNAGATWQFQATAHVNPNSVTLADCDVVNTVHITTPVSADPGYAAQAHEKVPQLFINVGPGPVAVYCDPPSLKLSKTAGTCVPASGGYDCPFTVTAISTGPDPYHGTVELDEVLPAGTSYKSSSWSCVPTTGNDVHCSSPPQTINVGHSVSMQIVIFVPKAEAARSQCAITNTVNAAISAEVLHSDKGAQYTASATAKLPASACAKPPVCKPNQLKPGGGCCDGDLVWDGRKCTPPKPIIVPPKCPKDSVLGDTGACVCKDGTHGKPGQCVPDQVVPVCPKDSHVDGNGNCVCDEGTHGKPGRCVPDQVVPVCPRDSHVDGNGNCVCDEGTHGRPGRCVPDQVLPVCPKDSHLDDSGACACDKGTHGTPGRCVPDQVVPICPRDSQLSDGECTCRPGTHGTPGKCVPDRIVPIVPVEPIKPVVPSCPDDSHYDRAQKNCVCNAPLRGEPGKCAPLLRLQVLPPATIN